MHWVPRHVLVTRSAAELPHGRRIVQRCAAAGIDDVTMLGGDRLPSLRGGSEREVYARAKQTLAVVVAPPSAVRPQPIPPSADWRLDLAKGCPAHYQYCGTKYVYPAPVMRELRTWFERQLATTLPAARPLYWT